MQSLQVCQQPVHRAMRRASSLVQERGVGAVEEGSAAAVSLARAAQLPLRVAAHTETPKSRESVVHRIPNRMECRLPPTFRISSKCVPQCDGSKRRQADASAGGITVIKLQTFLFLVAAHAGFQV